MNLTEAILALFGLVLAIRFAALLLRLREVRADADEVWRARRADYADLGEERFKRVFRKVHGARGALLGFAAVAVAAAVTPFALALLNTGWREAWMRYGQDPAYREGTLVWMFFLFFAMVGVWALIAWIFAVVYHRGRPRSLDAEIKLARFDAGE